MFAFEEKLKYLHTNSLYDILNQNFKELPNNIVVKLVYSDVIDEKEINFYCTLSDVIDLVSEYHYDNLFEQLEQEEEYEYEGVHDFIREVVRDGLIGKIDEPIKDVFDTLIRYTCLSDSLRLCKARQHSLDKNSFMSNNIINYKNVNTVEDYDPSLYIKLNDDMHLLYIELFANTWKAKIESNFII